MTKKIDIYTENTNSEVLARIVKAASNKYNCSMEIDYSEGRRISKFIGDQSLKPHIAKEVHEIFHNE